MKIGLYNRYWNTRGGGERYAGVMAEILSQDHEVELLGPDPVALPGLAEHLGIDLSRSRFRLLPPATERELSPVTAEYDLLINCTYLSRLPSQARKSVYVVLFPQSPWPQVLVRPARRLLRTFDRRTPEAVEPLGGFYGADASGSRWSRNVARLRVHPWAFHRGRARIRLAPPPFRSLAESVMDIQGNGVSWTLGNDALTIERQTLPADRSMDLEIRCRTFIPAEVGLSGDRRSLGVRLVDPGKYRVETKLRTFARRAAGRLDGHDPKIPSSYDLLLSISEFTRTWVEKRWRQPSEVLAPPVDTTTFSAPDPGDKGKVILSVGRFFHGSHNKKHLEMLRVFRGMVDRGQVPDGWEYHLVGNLHRNRMEDLEYFAELEHLTDGYPVKILIDLSLDRLIEEYRHASIFWHAAGWGENERRQPEKFEHFGLTTCEAMSAGCIPVVIAKAGQLEIVDHGETGFLFRTADELAGLTKRLIDGHGEPWTHELAERARRSVGRFDRKAFEERLLRILATHDLVP